jgi:AraC-like DNA-binding protein
MTRQLYHPAAADARAARLRFWRPFPREIADVICGEGAVVELPTRAHDALQVILPASRCAVVDGRGTPVTVYPGQVHVTAPLELHGVRSLGDGPCAVRVILVAPAALPGRGEELARFWRGAAPGLRQLVVDDAALYAELWGLGDELRDPLVAPGCAVRLLRCLARLLAGPSAQPARTPKARAGRRAAAVGRVCDHLRAHATESVSLDELACVAGLSKYYLLRAFHRAYGVTPHAYQMQLRLAHAWRFVVEGRALSRATYDAGFADQSHFTRRFAALFGLTPARYARQLAVPPGAPPGPEAVASPAA